MKLVHTLASYIAFHTEIPLYPWQRAVMEAIQRGERLTLQVPNRRRPRSAPYVKYTYDTQVFHYVDGREPTREEAALIRGKYEVALRKSFTIIDDELIRPPVETMVRPERRLPNLPYYRQFERRRF